MAKAMYPTIKQALEALRASLAEASGFDPAHSQRHFRISIPHPMGPFYALALRGAAAAVAPGIVLTFDTVSLPVDLRVLPIPLELPPMPVYMIWHETRRNDTAHRWLREVVAEKLGRFAGA